MASLLAAFFCVPALAVTESEVEAQVAATSKGEVAGSVLIWFLCAIAFLKVSQKIDSFMGSLGLNAGRTGGSLIADAMIAMRAVTMVVGGGRRVGGRASPSGSGASGGANSGWFLKGGLAGVVSRHVTNSAARTATTQTSAVHTAQSSVRQAAPAAASSAEASAGGPQEAGPVVNNNIRSGGVDIHTGGGASDNAAPQEGVIVTGAGASSGSSIVQDIHAGGGNTGLQGSMPIGEQSVPNVAGPGAEISQSASITNNIHPGGDDIHATVSMPIETAPPQEGVIITGNMPIGEQPAPNVTGSEAEISQGTSVTNNIHPGGDDLHTTVSMPTGTTPPQEGVIVTDAGAPSTSQEVTNGSCSMTAADGTVLNIPRTGDAIPTAPSRSTTATPQVDDAPAPESLSMAELNEAGPGFGAVPNISPVGATVPASPSQEGTAPAPSQTENVSVQENTSVAEGGPVLNTPQAGGAASSGPVTPSSPQEGVVITGAERHTNTRTATSSQSATDSQTTTSTVDRSHTSVSRSRHTQGMSNARPSLGGMIFSRSLVAGGNFANDVIGTVARGEVSGSITGDMAAQSLTSYMGYSAIKETARDVPVYTDVEIGRGRITGVETAAGSAEGLPFAMYHVGQYEAPSGEFQKVYSADGTPWYKQYAQDAVERKPYKAPDDTVAYHEKIVKKMPNPPRRKDRM